MELQLTILEIFKTGHCLITGTSYLRSLKGSKISCSASVLGIATPRDHKVVGSKPGLYYYRENNKKYVHKAGKWAEVGAQLT